MSDPRVVIAGGTGFLGQTLASALNDKGYEVVILSRNPSHSLGQGTVVGWDGKSLAGRWPGWLEGAASVVNLAGRSVNCRYTPANRKEIDDSRVDSTRVIAEAISQCSRPPGSWIQAGSLAIYGDTADRVCDEHTPAGTGFPVETCLKWEAAFRERGVTSTRQVLFRIGFVLKAGQGALATLEGITRLYLGGRAGPGRQFISWIHHHDLNRMFLAAIEGEDLSGTYNATGPSPVDNNEFMRELRRALGRPWAPPTPSWAVHLGAFFMRTEASLALTGRRCLPARLQESGFRFQFADLRAALGEIYQRPTIRGVQNVNETPAP